MILDYSEKATTAKTPVYSPDDLKSVDLDRIPKHVAIVMDGNRRWSSTQNLPVELGHAKGASQLREIVQAAVELKINTLTVFALSTENTNRPNQELETLFSLFKKYLRAECQTMIENGINFDTIGNIEGLPLDLQDLIQEIKEKTQNGNQLNLVIAINYGGRDELCRAFQKIVQAHHGTFEPGFQLTPDELSTYLDTVKWGDPQLVIRTSGEYRVSNFLLWQMSYAEIYFSSVYWPEFSPHFFLKAIQSYQHREIRRGL